MWAVAVVVAVVVVVGLGVVSNVYVCGLVVPGGACWSSDRQHRQWAWQVCMLQVGGQVTGRQAGPTSKHTPNYASALHECKHI